MQPETIKQLIEEGMPGARAQVVGDGQHFEAIIVSEAFEGLSMIKQHQLVYSALGDRMRADIHALSMRTLTPTQWAAMQK